MSITNKLSLLWLGLFSVIFLFSMANAQAAKTTEEIEEVCDGNNSAFCQGSRSQNDPLKELLIDIINIMLYAVGALSVIFVVFGGFRYTKSNGDSGKVTEAKNAIVYALVGLVVALVANRLIVFVLNRLL